jgi:membrane fusion protein, multidrug efflux system
MRSNAKKKLTITFAVVLAVSLVAYYIVSMSKKKAEAKTANGPASAAQASAPAKSDAAPAAPAAAPAPEVTVIKIEKQNAQQSLQLPARVIAYKTSEVRPRVGGIIKERIFEEGSFVKKGQQLYQIDPEPFQIEYNNAAVNLKTVKAKYQRFKELIGMEAISKQEFDDMKATFAQAQAAFNLAKNSLGYTKVYAPISGYIGKSNFTEGALAVANQDNVLTTITQLDPVYVDMEQPSRDALQIGNQRKVSVILETEDGTYDQKGVLEFSEVFADQSTDSINLRAKFPNGDKKLIPGMFVTAKLNLKPINAITVPQRATTRTPDGNLSVWVVNENNVANPKIIKAKNAYGASWIVEDGLNEGDVIIYEGFMKIAPGATVKPVFLDSQNNQNNTEKKS